MKSIAKVLAPVALSFAAVSANAGLVEIDYPFHTMQSQTAAEANTGAAGGSLHLGGELFMIATNVKLTRVPYKSTGPALLGLLTNEVQLVFATAGGAMGHIKDGRMKALGVTSSQLAKFLESDREVWRWIAEGRLKPDAEATGR